MQYVLTEQEKAELVPRKDYEDLEKALQWCFRRLQPVHCPHLGREHKLNPHCNDGGGCPFEVIDIRKHADRVPRKLAKLICTLPRSYGK